MLILWLIKHSKDSQAVPVDEDEARLRVILDNTSLHKTMPDFADLVECNAGLAFNSLASWCKAVCLIAVIKL